MVRPCSWTPHRFQVTGGGRTAYKHTRVKEYDKEVVNWERSVFRNHDAGDANLELRWTKKSWPERENR